MKHRHLTVKQAHKLLRKSYTFAKYRNVMRAYLECHECHVVLFRAREEYERSVIASN
jgi:hypothetical protein